MKSSACHIWTFLAGEFFSFRFRPVEIWLLKLFSQPNTTILRAIHGGIISPAFPENTKSTAERILEKGSKLSGKGYAPHVRPFGHSFFVLLKLRYQALTIKKIVKVLSKVSTKFRIVHYRERLHQWGKTGSLSEKNRTVLSNFKGAVSRACSPLFVFINRIHLVPW